MSTECKNSGKSAAADIIVTQSSSNFWKKVVYSKAFCRFMNKGTNSKEDFSFKFTILSLKNNVNAAQLNITYLNIRCEQMFHTHDFTDS